MFWINSGGGPLIFLEKRLLEEWNGIDCRSLPSSGDLDDEFDNTDYGRACECNDLICLLPVGNGHAIILGDEPFATCWLPPTGRSDSSGMLVRWGYANSESEVEREVTSLAAQLFPPQGLVWNIERSPLFLFDSASPGRSASPELNDCLELELLPGRYQISTLDYRPNDDMRLILHCFRTS